MGLKEKLKDKIYWNIPFSLGVIVISLLNIILINLNRNQILFDWYIFGIFSVVLTIFILIFFARKKKK